MEKDMYARTESMVREILERLGTKREFNANAVYDDDGDLCSCSIAKGLEYEFDNMKFQGYYFLNEFFYEVIYEYNHVFYKREGKIKYNSNDPLMNRLLNDIYNSLDVLEPNEKAKEEFLRNYDSILPWPELTSYWADNQERQNYIRELGITLVLYQYIYNGGNDYTERIRYYKIYDGNKCVFDSKANLFIDGPWKKRLIDYSKRLKQAEMDEYALKKQRKVNASLQRLQSIKNNTNRY
jgi:hypothetical protein